MKTPTPSTVLFSIVLFLLTAFLVRAEADLRWDDGTKRYVAQTPAGEKVLERINNQVAFYYPAPTLSPAQAPAPAPAPTSPSIGNGQSAIENSPRFSLSPFASYRVNQDGFRNGKFGGGLAAGFSLHKHLTLEAEAIAERFDDSDWGGSFTEAGANFLLPILPGRPVNPYVLIGYTRNLDSDENRMNAGAGLQLNLSPHVGAFVDGRWTHDFNRVGHALFRTGLSVRF